MKLTGREPRGKKPLRPNTRDRRFKRRYLHKIVVIYNKLINQKDEILVRRKAIKRKVKDSGFERMEYSAARASPPNRAVKYSMS